MDASYSNVILPIEVLREFVLRDLSPSSLARWCRVGSHDLLTFAGRLLYKTVTLKKADDVLPFIERLLVRPPSSPHLALDGITRLELLELPDRKGLVELYKDKSHLPMPTDNLVLAVQWPNPVSASAKIEMAHTRAMVFLPAFIGPLQPIACEEMGQRVNGGAPVVLKGVYLSLYHRLGLRLPWEDYRPPMAEVYFYCTNLPRVEEDTASIVKSFSLVDRAVADLGPAVEDLIDRINDVKDRITQPFDYASVRSADDLDDRFTSGRSALNEWHELIRILEENLKRIQASDDDSDETDSQLADTSSED